MKYLKFIGIFLLIAILAMVVISTFTPNKQRVVRSIFIDASPRKVYDQLSKLENFNKWTVWNLNDPSIKHVLTGQDGTIGATSAWKGDPDLSGEGKVVITSLIPPKKIIHNIEISTPRKSTAESEFDLVEMNGGTMLNWEFDLSTPRPWNIFNLFYTLDKRMGKDFDQGLLLMKAAIESGDNTSKIEYDVKPMNYPATSLAFIRQQVKKVDIPAYFAQHFPLIIQEIENIKVPVGVPQGLFFRWNDTAVVADLAAAITVPAETSIKSQVVEVMRIPATKAVYTIHRGRYSGLPDVYNSIIRYLANNHLTQKPPTIEEYIINPLNEKDTARWQTKVICLVE